MPSADPAHHAVALAAADNAEWVLPLFEAACPDDPRPRQAMEAARAWARGEITVSAARVAAFAAHPAAREAPDEAANAAATTHAPHAAAYARKAAELNAAASAPPRRG